jgi:hypothetical protein
MASLLALGVAAASVDTGSAASALSITVSEVAQPVASLAASQTPATVTCPAGTVLVGGGIRAYYTGPPNPGVLEPINGLVVRGLMTSDSGGNLSGSGATSPSSWTAIGGFAGQNENNDQETGYAMCASGGPPGTQIVVTTIAGPSAAQTTANATATCPSGTRLVGGGGQVTPASQPSVKPDGSYPSDAAGNREGVTSDPTSWTVTGEAGGLMMGAGSISTTALAICSTDAGFDTTVVMASVLDHPAGPGNANAGSDPVATVTATCPSGTTLLSGGALTTGNAPGDDGGNLQQGVHLRGSYPSDGSGNAVPSGATNPSSWTAIVQSGGQLTPGTDSFAYALCANAPAASSGGGGGGGSSTTSTATSAPGSTTTATSGAGTTTADTQTTATTPAVTKTVTAAAGKAGSLSVGSGASPIELSWSTEGLAGAPLTIKTGLVTSSAAAAAVSVVARTKSGHLVTSFAHPLDIGFSGAPGGVVPAFSSDGKTWTRIPRLPGSTLLAGLTDGYYKDSLGALHILTLHATDFGLLTATAGKAAAPEPLSLGYSIPARIKAGGNLRAEVLATRAGALTVTVTHGGKTLATGHARLTTAAKTLSLPLPVTAKPGVYELRLAISAGPDRVSHGTGVLVDAPAT